MNAPEDPGKGPVIRATSSLESVELPETVADCSFPLSRSLAETLTMPLASMSKATSICGMPRGDGAMPVRSNMPSFLLWAVISRSPWYTWICTDGWLSSAVVKICDFLVGIVVFRSMSLVKTPPLVSMPSECGVTSNSAAGSLASPCSAPATRQAPAAASSSGVSPHHIALPWVSDSIRLITAGI